MPNEFKAKNGVITPILQSTATTGTAPLVVASTTRVSNLNVATAGTADTLTTTRTIWGQNFNGSANVTGDLASVGNITGTGAINLTATGAALNLTATGANIIALNTNSSERIRIDSSGNVGINTTVQYHFLQVNGAASTANNISIAAAFKQNGSNSDAITAIGIGVENASFVKGGIGWQRVGSNYDTGSLIFYNRSTADSSSFTSSDARLVINSSGQMLVTGAGTAALPVISKSDDTNTGIFFPAADTLAASTNGSERMRLDSSGNVGIGTSSPLSRLDVREANRANSTNITNLGVYTTTAQAADVGGTIGLGGIFDASTGYAPFGSIRGGKENSTVNNYAGYLAFQTISNGGVLTERMRLDSSGNLGLGVTPSAWGTGVAIQTRGAGLWDNGVNNFYLSQNSFYNGTNWIYRNSFAATSYLQNNGAHQWYSAPSGTAGNTFSFSQQMHLNLRGDLGIGGVTPPTLNGVSGLVSNYLNVIGGSGLYLTGNAYYDGAWKYYGSGTAAEYEIVNGEHRWKNTSVSGTVGNAISFTQAMTLDASGYLGIGLTSPVGRVSIKGASGASALQQLGFQYHGSSSYFMALGIQDISGNAQVMAGSGASLVFYTNSDLVSSNERMRITSTGDVGIGTSSPGAKLHVVGNTYVQSGTIFTDTLAAYSTSLTLNAGNFLAALTGGTERLRINSSGAWGLSGANYGTSGQVLTSNGSGSAPTWQSAGGGTPDYVVQSFGIV